MNVPDVVAAMLVLTLLVHRHQWVQSVKRAAREMQVAQAQEASRLPFETD
jgi:hypothetical protein